MQTEDHIGVESLHSTGWLLKLITWDGLMPAVVLSAPAFVRWAWPGNVGLREAAAVMLPILAFFIRLFVGLRHIRRNACGPKWRIAQHATLFFAAVLLVLVDCMLILAQDMPPGALFATTVDLIVWGVLAVLYVSLMAFSLYPGRHAPAEVQDVDPWSQSIPPT